MGIERRLKPRSGISFGPRKGRTQVTLASMTIHSGAALANHELSRCSHNGVSRLTLTVVCSESVVRFGGSTPLLPPS